MSMETTRNIPTPELDKQAEARENGSQAVGEFIEWLQSGGYTICREDLMHGDPYRPVFHDTEVWLAEFYGIDLGKIEAERRDLLGAIRMDDES